MNPLKSILALTALFAIYAPAATAQHTDGNGGTERDMRICTTIARLKTLLQPEGVGLCRQLRGLYTEPQALGSVGIGGPRTCDTPDYTRLIAALECQSDTRPATVRIAFTDRRLEVDGEVKTALNSPGLITINQPRWENISDELEKLGLMTHEFLGATGSTLDLDYSLSSEFVRLMQSRKWMCSAVCVTRDYSQQRITKYGALVGEAWEAMLSECRQGQNRMLDLFRTFRSWRESREITTATSNGLCSAGEIPVAGRNGYPAACRLSINEIRYDGQNADPSVCIQQY